MNSSWIVDWFATARVRPLRVDSTWTVHITSEQAIQHTSLRGGQTKLRELEGEGKPNDKHRLVSIQNCFQLTD